MPFALHIITITCQYSLTEWIVRSQVTIWRLFPISLSQSVTVFMQLKVRAGFLWRVTSLNLICGMITGGIDLVECRWYLFIFFYLLNFEWMAVHMCLSFKHFFFDFSIYCCCWWCCCCFSHTLKYINCITWTIHSFFFSLVTYIYICVYLHVYAFSSSLCIDLIHIINVCRFLCLFVCVYCTLFPFIFLAVVIAIWLSSCVQMRVCTCNCMYLYHYWWWSFEFGLIWFGSPFWKSNKFIHAVEIIINKMWFLSTWFIKSHKFNIDCFFIAA